MAKVTKIPATVSRFTAEPIARSIRRKVAGYARVSTDHEEQLTSYEAQLDYYTNLIKGHADWEYAGMYSDEGVTGTSTKRREGFQSMVADALAGHIDLIITKSVSRFARNTVDSLTTIRQLKEKGVEVYFEKENIWTFDSKGELLITIMSSLAQEESRSISENVIWGRRKSMADGKVAVAYSRFIGYDCGEDGTLVVNPEQAKIVRLIYSEFVSGLSYCAIAEKLTRLGIRTPGGKDVWNQHTVKSILTNEKYKGDALLQKTYIEDFLTKKQVTNHGEVPQYYVENDHEAIIEPALFDRVQDMIKERNARKGYSGVTIFSSKIRCGECGGWYGSKVWHSTDCYRRVIWQCNAKFKQKTGCKTPHLTENAIRDSFIRVCNRLITDRTEILDELRAIQTTLTDTAGLENEQARLAEQMNIDAEAVQQDVAGNAHAVQRQEDYRERHELLVSRFNDTKAKYDAVTAEIQMRRIREREFVTFIKEIEQMPDIITEFDEGLWGSMVDYVTVYAADNIVFTLTNGMEIKL